MIETLLIIEDEKLLGFELSRHYLQPGWDVELATIQLKDDLLLVTSVQKASFKRTRHGSLLQQL